MGNKGSGEGGFTNGDHLHVTTLEVLLERIGLVDDADLFILIAILGIIVHDGLLVALFLLHRYST